MMPSYDPQNSDGVFGTARPDPDGFRAVETVENAAQTVEGTREESVFEGNERGYAHSKSKRALYIRAGLLAVFGLILFLFRDSIFEAIMPLVFEFWQAALIPAAVVVLIAAGVLLPDLRSHHRRWF